ncbi:unnamed protein product [Brassica oleracea]
MILMAECLFPEPFYHLYIFHAHNYRCDKIRCLVYFHIPNLIDIKSIILDLIL